MDIDTLTPRQLVCGLMRGDASDLKLGYSADAAVHTVAQMGSFSKDREPLTQTELDELQAFAEGFAIGINENTALLNPVTV
jgi:hypothetical protein